MICICDTGGQGRAEAARLALTARLGVEAIALTPTLWRSLHDDFKATVSVASDQWFGVWAEVGDTKFRMECDDPIDGLIFVWNQLAEVFPERIPSTVARVDAALTELSEQQLKEHAEADAASKAHREVCTSSCKPWPPCEIGKPLVERFYEAGRALIQKWGKPLPEDEKAFYGIEDEP